MINKETTAHASVLMDRKLHKRAKSVSEGLGYKLSTYVVKLVEQDVSRKKSAVEPKNGN